MFGIRGLQNLNLLADQQTHSFAVGKDHVSVSIVCRLILVAGETVLDVPGMMIHEKQQALSKGIKMYALKEDLAVAHTQQLVHIDDDQARMGFRAAARTSF